MIRSRKGVTELHYLLPIHLSLCLVHCCTASFFWYAVMSGSSLLHSVDAYHSAQTEEMAAS